jgi:endonuclease/exonuclease/phosphatase family metal-dependent hydrolase
MKRHLRFLILIAALAGRAVAEDPADVPAEKPPPGPVLAVATYNINWGNIDLRRTALVIRKASADLVLLQETNARSEVFLRRQLARDYREIRFQGHQGRHPAEGLGILSKLPVENLKFVKPAHGLFGAWIGEVKWNGHAVQFANVHLQPLFLDENKGLLAAWEAFRQVEETHAREIEQIYQNLSPRLPILVAGDFNSMSHLAAPQFLVRKGLVDSFASVTAEPEGHPTWRWPTRRLNLSGRIDYIFHTRRLRTAGSQVVESEASDHHLLVSRLEWVP